MGKKRSPGNPHREKRKEKLKKQYREDEYTKS